LDQDSGGKASNLPSPAQIPQHKEFNKLRTYEMALEKI